MSEPANMTIQLLYLFASEFGKPAKRILRWLVNRAKAFKDQTESIQTQEIVQRILRTRA